MINDFDLLGIFIPNYTTNIVVNTIKERLLNYTKDNDKLQFLDAVLNLHMDKNYNSVDNLMIKRANYSNHPVILAQLDAYYPIKDWIEERRDEIEKAIKKDQSNKEKKQLLEAAQTTFEIREKYRSLLPDMWRLMKDSKIYLIHQETLFEDFNIIFTNKNSKEVKRPIIWTANKITLLELFKTLCKEDVIVHKTLSFDKNNPLNTCFTDIAKKPFKEWRKTYNKLKKTTRINEYKQVAKVLNLFN